MVSVFLSYAHSNAVAAKYAADGLTAEGFEVWWDEQLPAHRKFHEVIDERLRSAEAVVALWSVDAAKSDWVRAEADFARANGKLVQASLDDDLPPMPFNQIQCAKLANWKGDTRHAEWLKVLNGVRAVVGGEPRSVHATPPTPQKRRWRVVTWMNATLAIVAIAVAAGIYLRSNLGRATSSAPTTGAALLSTGEPRMAVLPFEAIGGSTAAEFAVALADAASGSLSENFVQTLAAARSAEFAANDRRSKLKALGVNFALGGSVRVNGANLIVRVYFEDLSSEFTVWSAQFERESNQQALLATEVAVAATEVAYNITEALAQPDAGLDSQALSLLLKLGNATSNFRPESSQRVLVMHEQLIARAPKSAVAHGSFALTLAEAGVSARARQEAETSIAIYPAAGAAYDALYFLTRDESPTDLVLADRALGTGLAAAPRFPFLWMRQCEFLMDVGRMRDALGSCRQAAALQPLAPPVAFRLVSALWYAGDERATAELERAAAKYPDNHWVNKLRFEQFVGTGQANDAAAMLVAPATRPGFVSQEALPLYQAFLVALGSRASGDVDAAIKKLQVAISAGKFDPARAAVFAAELGRVDEALALLGQVDVSAFVGRNFIFNPALREVHRDPRFMALFARTGHIAYWRTTGVWPDLCVDPTLPYRCQAEADKALPER